jgi:hypothetical protein
MPKRFTERLGIIYVDHLLRTVDLVYIILSFKQAVRSRDEVGLVYLVNELD